MSFIHHSEWNQWSERIHQRWESIYSFCDFACNNYISMYVSVSRWRCMGKSTCMSHILSFAVHFFSHVLWTSFQFSGPLILGWMMAEVRDYNIISSEWAGTIWSIDTPTNSLWWECDLRDNLRENVSISPNDSTFESWFPQNRFIKYSQQQGVFIAIGWRVW